MSLRQKYVPTKFPDLVFHDQHTSNAVFVHTDPNFKSPLLLWGEPGAGKSAIARAVLLERSSQLGPKLGSRGNDPISIAKSANLNGVDLHSGGVAQTLSNKTQWQQILLGELILWIDEIDVLDKTEQNALRSWLDEYPNIKIIATTNETPLAGASHSKLISALVSRFDCIEIKRPSLNAAMRRIQHVFANEGFPITDSDARSLLQACGTDLRQIWNQIERAIFTMRAKTNVASASPANTHQLNGNGQQATSISLATTNDQPMFPNALQKTPPNLKSVK